MQRICVAIRVVMTLSWMLGEATLRMWEQNGVLQGEWPSWWPWAVLSCSSALV